MRRTDQIFNYCERGFDPAFWAEPLNAASNTAFLIAAVLAGFRLCRQPRSETAEAAVERLWLWLLVALVAIIGIGSFLFHTLATRWAQMADVVPISLFMVAYLAFALRIFLGLGWIASGAGLAGFLLMGAWASSLTCATRPLIAITSAARAPCFNGSLGYAPALMALVVIGALVARQRATGRLLLAAAAVFFVSMGLRTLDRDICAATHVLGRLRGTHALWHLLNALTLHLLLAAAIGHPRPPVEEQSRSRQRSQA